MAKSFQMQVQASKSGLLFSRSETSCIHWSTANKLIYERHSRNYRSSWSQFQIFTWLHLRWSSQFVVTRKTWEV